MSTDNNQFIDIVAKLSAQVEPQLIHKPDIIPVQIKRGTTANGLIQLERGKKPAVGDNILINLKSLRGKEITDGNGNKHLMPVVNTCDVNGKDLGWIFAEMLFL